MLSRDETFHAVTGLEAFASNTIRSAHRMGGATYVNATKPEIKVKPQPETWVHMAQLKWAKKHGVDTAQASYGNGEGTGAHADAETQDRIIEAIQEEQNRVYKQDQALMSRIYGGSQDGLKTPDDGTNLEDEPIDDTFIEDMAHGPYEFKELENDIIKYIC